MLWGQVYFAPDACRQGSESVADRPVPGKGDQLYWQVTLPRCRRVGLSGRRYSETSAYQKRSLLTRVWLSSLI